MKKYKIINNTNLNNEDIGVIIDYIIANSKEDTLYYGKHEYCIANYKKHKIYIDIVYMKDFVRWYFRED